MLEHLQQGGASLPPATSAELAGLVDLALRALLADDCAPGAALRRLWRSAPVVEAVPAPFARMNGTTR